MHPHHFEDDGDGNCALCPLPRANPRAHPPQAAAAPAEPVVPAPAPAPVQEQLEPVTDPPVRTGMNHPPASFAAARLAEQVAGSVRAQIVEHVAARGEHGATDAELEALLHGSHQTVSAARNAVVAAGWLHPKVDNDGEVVKRAPQQRPGHRKPTPSTVWVLTPAARHQLQVRQGAA